MSSENPTSANSEIEQFASIASHDLHEPLRMVSSYLGLLERRAAKKLDAKELDYLRFAVDGAQRMARMLDDLAAFSRIATHGKPFTQADLRAVVENALADLSAEIAARKAHVSHSELPIAEVDAEQFAQLFRQLIGNALKFSGPRAPAVSIGCERRDEKWIFSVRDNGIGIDAKEFERIFELFARLHGRSEYPGAGLGLAICKKIVERHGGRIWVESVGGEGSTFYFTLPAAQPLNSGFNPPPTSAIPLA